MTPIELIALIGAIIVIILVIIIEKKKNVLLVILCLSLKYIVKPKIKVDATVKPTESKSKFAILMIF